MSRGSKFCFLALWVIAYQIAFAQGENAVRKLLNAQVAAWNAGNVEGYMKGYWDSDSTVFISGGNITRATKACSPVTRNRTTAGPRWGSLSLRNWFCASPLRF